MKTLLILFCALYLVACSKQDNNPDSPQPASEEIGYNSLKMLVKEGSVLKYERIDSLILQATSGLNRQAILASLHWDNKKREADTNIGYVYKDTSLETITISGSVRLKDLPKKYSASYLQSVDPSLTDTNKVTVWYIHNQTWNRTDTAYVYLNSKVLWIFTQAVYLPGRSIKQPPNIYLRLPLKKSGWNGIYGLDGAYDNASSIYSKSDTTFVIRNISYSNGIYIAPTLLIKQASFGGLAHDSDANELYLSASGGLIQHTSSYYYFAYLTDGVLVNVRRRFLP